MIAVIVLSAICRASLRGAPRADGGNEIDMFLLIGIGRLAPEAVRLFTADAPRGIGCALGPYQPLTKPGL